LDEALASGRVDLKTLGLSSRDVIGLDRAYIRRGVRDPLTEGFHHNAAFLSAHWADKAHHAMAGSGPAAEVPHRRILDRLGYARAEAVATKDRLIEAYIRRIQALVDAARTV